MAEYKKRAPNKTRQRLCEMQDYIVESLESSGNYQVHPNIHTSVPALNVFPSTHIMAGDTRDRSRHAIITVSRLRSLASSVPGKLVDKYNAAMDEGIHPLFILYKNHELFTKMRVDANPLDCAVENFGALWNFRKPLGGKIFYFNPDSSEVQLYQFSKGPVRNTSRARHIRTFPNMEQVLRSNVNFLQRFQREKFDPQTNLPLPETRTRRAG